MALETPVNAALPALHLAGIPPQSNSQPVKTPPLYICMCRKLAHGHKRQDCVHQSKLALATKLKSRDAVNALFRSTVCQ